MTEESDDFRRLMDAVLKGDGEALASLFSLYRDRLRRMVELRMDARLRGRVSASDILQEAYIGALKRLPHYQASSDIPLFVWLRSVTMQRLIDVHRRHLGGQVRDASREIRLGEVEAIEAGSGQIAELIRQYDFAQPGGPPGRDHGAGARCARAARCDRPRGAGAAALRADEQSRSGRGARDQAGGCEQAVCAGGRAAQECAGADPGF